MGLPALRYPVLIPQVASGSLMQRPFVVGRSVDSGENAFSQPVIVEAETIFGTEGDVTSLHEIGHDDDDSIEVINPPSREMARLLESGRELASPVRLGRFAEVGLIHEFVNGEDYAAVVARLADGSDLQNDIIKIARAVVCEHIIELARNFSDSPEFSIFIEDFETRVGLALHRIAEVKVLFTDSWREQSVLSPEQASGCYRKASNEIFLNKRRGSLAAVLKTAIHELLHVAEAELGVGKDLKTVWFMRTLPKRWFASERIMRLALGEGTEADFASVVSAFGVRDALDLPAVEKLFRVGFENWHEILIDSLAITGLNHFIAKMPVETVPDLVFGAESMVPPYENFPVSEDEFEASVGVRGYPIAHVLAAEARHMIAESGPDMADALQRIEILAYGAMFFATPQNASDGESPSALESRFMNLLNQAIEDLGEMRLLFFLSMLATSSGEVSTRTVIPLN